MLHAHKSTPRPCFRRIFFVTELVVINSGLHSLLAKTDFFTLAKLGPEKELIIAVFVFRREVGLTASSCKVLLFVSITVRVSTMLPHWHCSYCYLETKSETGLRGERFFMSDKRLFYIPRRLPLSLKDTCIMRLRMNDRKQAEISNFTYNISHVCMFSKQ